MAILKLAPHSKPKTTPPRKRADWDAVRRDFRTGKYTLRELQAKHGVHNATISRHARDGSWVEDLSIAIKQATDAKLIQAAVAAECSKSQKKTVDTVLAAADFNAGIILSHRERLTELALSVDKAKATVLLLGASVSNIRESAIFMQAVCNLASATRNLIEMERRAHNLDDNKHQAAQNDLAALLDTLAEQGSRLPTIPTGEANRRMSDVP